MNKKILYKIILLFVIVFAFGLIGLQASANSESKVDYLGKYYWLYKILVKINHRCKNSCARLMLRIIVNYKIFW